MQANEDEIQNSEFLPLEAYDFELIPPEHCFYCGVHNPNSILQCQTCSNWYCTDPISGGSHFTWHLNLRDHKIWSNHPRSAKFQGLFHCKRCSNSNMTMLCVLNKTEILCRGCGMKAKNYDKNACFEDLISNGNPSSTAFGQSSIEEKEKKRKLNKRQVNKIEDNIKKGLRPFDGLEDLPEFIPPMTKIKKAYSSAEEYTSMYRGLLYQDMKYNEEDTKTKNISGIRMVFNGLNGKFDYDRLETGIKLSVGSPITIYRHKGNGLDEISDGIVISIDSTTKKVSFKAKKRHPDLKTGDNFELKVKFIAVPYERMLNGLNDFPKILKNLKNNIIGKIIQISNSGFSNSAIDTPPSDWIAPNLEPLNDSQLHALKQALKSNIALIQGPPGTGKTQSSAVFVWKLNSLLKNRGNKSKILVTSNSNVAVDNLLERIHKTGLRVIKVASKLRESIKSSSQTVHDNSLHVLLKKFVHENHKKMSDLFDMKYEYDEQLEEKRFKELMDVVNPTIRKILNEADVICCTNIVSADPRLKGFIFPYVLIDEASQLTEPETLLPALKGCRQLVLVGDQMQLGPMTKCRRTQAAGFTRSLMIRLIHLGIQPSLLQYQYRMHPSISEFPGLFFYNDQLLNGINSSHRPLIQDFWPNDVPNIFLHNEFTEASSGKNSISNVNEAFEVLNVIKKLNEKGVGYQRIVVLTPYEAQKKAIVELTLMDKIEIKVLNIDEFQGNEEDYIVFSTVRSNIDNNIGFLNDFRRMNVAITRAKFGLIILGNCKILGKSKLWGHLVKYYSSQKMIYEGNFGKLRLCTYPPPDPAPYNFDDLFPYSDQVTLE